VNILKRLGKIVLALLVIILIGVAGYLYVAPPELLRVATNYSAKIVCSNYFLADRNPEEVQEIDVQAGGHPILQYIHVNVDETESLVTSRLLGLFATGWAVYRPGLGCASVPDGDIATAKAVQLDQEKIVAAHRPSEWEMAPSIPAVDSILANDELVGPAMRAVVVIKDGKILAETYGADFDENTRLLGWSMTKTVTAMLLGTAYNDQFSKDSTQLFPNWENDARNNIKVSDLMGMHSGLDWNEGYGSVSDVTRMLYLEPDMAAFVAAKELQTPTDEARFLYSSGTTVLLSAIWQKIVGDGALEWPHIKLFGPLGMGSAIMEADARGTYVGSSYLYATARDWARLGQLLVNGGRWQNLQLISQDHVNWMLEPNPQSMTSWGKPQYANGQIWLNGPGVEGGLPDDPDAQYDLPSEIRWFRGHDGQTMAIIPSENLVVLRMGLTPSHLNYRPQKLVAAIRKAINDNQ
jgi:CubicO group peptidase (beta-lactamase class C family)